MSRKRPPSPPPSPPPKRHLNAALAARLQSLRISSPSRQIAPTRSAFGAAPSPFLSQPPRNSRPYNADVTFGDDFEQNLQQGPDVPVVTSPEPEPQDMAVESDSSTTVYQLASDDIIIEECQIDDDIDDDDDTSNGDDKTENRLIVYRPPVNMTAESVARLNARLPDGQLVLRNPRTHEWIMTETHNERLKRKLALVPWTGDAKRTLYERATAPSKVIPMPWHDTKELQDKAAAKIHAAVLDAEQIMDVDEVDDDP